KFANGLGLARKALEILDNQELSNPSDKEKGIDKANAILRLEILTSMGRMKAAFDILTQYRMGKELGQSGVIAVCMVAAALGDHALFERELEPVEFMAGLALSQKAPEQLLATNNKIGDPSKLLGFLHFPGALTL